MDEFQKAVERQTVNAELAAIRERLHFQEAALAQLQSERERTLKALDRTEVELKIKQEQLNEQRVNIELLREKLRSNEIELNMKDNEIRLVGEAKGRQAIVYSILYTIVAILFGVSINLVTSTQSNILGWVLLGIAFIVYIVAAFSSYTSTKKPK